MIERASEFGQSAAVPLISGDTSQQSAGDMLRQAREAHGLDAAVVAAALKVPVQKIEALEADDIDALPDPVFARALASSMCRALRMDPKPVLAKLPGAPRPDIGETQRAMSASFRTGVARSNGNLGSRTMLVVVGLLLAAAAALFWLPQSWLDQLSTSVDRLMARGESVAEAPVNGGVSGSVTEPVPVPPPALPAEPPPPAAAAPESAAAPMAAPAAPAEVAASHLIVFQVRDECWISVAEAGGKQLVQRIVPAGETLALSGNPPLSVTIGRASGVDVQVRGKAFDLAPFTRGGGVARFEVKP